jgi:hypothetical protein
MENPGCNGVLAMSECGLAINMSLCLFQGFYMVTLSHVERGFALQGDTLFRVNPSTTTPLRGDGRSTSIMPISYVNMYGNSQDAS